LKSVSNFYPIFLFFKETRQEVRPLALLLCG